jgi:hypothetical protein
VIQDGATKIIHHPALKHVKGNVGSALNKALEAIEYANLDALQDVLTVSTLTARLVSGRWMMTRWLILSRILRRFR